MYSTGQKRGTKLKEKANPKFTFADLFAGIGGMRIAFEKAGGRCILTCEIDDNALITYKANFLDPGHHPFFKDVNKLMARHFPKSGEDLGVIVAGFPCQPYSIAGLRKGLQDDRGGDIFKSLLRLLRTAQPKAFLLENVKGIKSHDNGETFEFMISKLEKCGYFLQYETLNSKDHANVPQNRERVFIVGFRSRSACDAFAFPKKIKLTKTIHDCLEPGKIDDRYYYDSRFPMSSKILKEVVKRDTIYQWRRQYVRENKSNACPTLTANMGSGGHNVPLIRDGRGVRKLTPRETANFQGFSNKSYKLPNISDSHLYHQIGNSVTVPLIQKIAKQIAKALELDS